MNVKDKALEVIELLDEIDSYDDGLTNELSNADSRISDLYHYLEEHKLKTGECYRFVQELKKVLLDRRKVKDDMSLLSVFKREKDKLLNDKNRVFLKQTIHKKNKELQESHYNNRVYTEEEINKILGGKNDL